MALFEPIRLANHALSYGVDPRENAAHTRLVRVAIVTVGIAALALGVWAVWPEAPVQPASATQGEIVKNHQSAGDVVRGWPHTAQNPSGQYSWDRHTCAGQYCVLGFMHNGYASGDVGIFVEDASDAALIPREGATAVAVAGHDGLHRRIDVGADEWVVGIRGTTIAIRLEAKPGTSEADLAEAHAVIDSMRTEPLDTKLGFRLVFTLSTNAWDSG